MTKQKQLSKKQLAVMDDLFAGELDEQAILKKHRLTRAIYNKWQADSMFTDHFDQRIEWLNRQGQAIIAKYATLAAAKLVELTGSENQETGRKACLDIINLPRPAIKESYQPAESQTPAQTIQLSQETASRLLAVLAKKDDDTTSGNHIEK